jgi:tripartite-type tricarboxylate transporter receptor subunit TctC
LSAPQWCVHPGLPVTNVKEFVDYAKLRRGELNYGSPGVGGPHHLAMELFKVVNEIVRKPHIVELAANQGVVTLGGTPEQLAEFLARDIATWQQVVKEAGIKAE